MSKWYHTVIGYSEDGDDIDITEEVEALIRVVKAADKVVQQIDYPIGWPNREELKDALEALPEGLLDD